MSATPSAVPAGGVEADGQGDAPAGDARAALKWSLLTSLLLQVVNTISGIELARGLGVEQRGALAAAMLWPLIVGNIATLGLEESLTYHIARQPSRAGRLLGSGLALFAIQSVVFTALTMGVVALALGAKAHDVVVGGLIYALYVPFNMLGVVFNGTLNGLHQYKACSLVRLTVGLLVIGVQTVLLITGPFTVQALVTAFVCCYLATAVVAGNLVRRAHPAGGVRADRETMRSIAWYGVRSHSSYVPASLNARLDQLVISVFLSTRQLGLYVVAVTLTSMTALIGGSVAYATLPNVASLPEGPGRVMLARRLVSLTLVVSTIVAVPIGLAAPLLLHGFFGEGFTSAGEVARILVLASIVLSTNRAIEAVLRGVGRPLAAGMSEFVGLGATAVALAALLPLMGLTGAAVASLIAYLVAGGWMLWRATKVLETTAMRLLIPDREALEIVRSRLRLIVAGIRGSRA
jgi:O-antigen/teichoic acid export membrane protein